MSRHLGGSWRSSALLRGLSCGDCCGLGWGPLWAEMPVSHSSLCNQSPPSGPHISF